jgi:hypothetical protein
MEIRKKIKKEVKEMTDIDDKIIKPLSDLICTLSDSIPLLTGMLNFFQDYDKEAEKKTNDINMDKEVFERETEVFDHD